jgi:hypothetical protein
MLLLTLLLTLLLMLPHSPQFSLQAPFIDMLNHKRPRQCSYQYLEDGHDGNGRFTISALQPVRKGEELFLTYGACGNRKLLLSYGFALGNDQNRCLSLPSPCPPSAPAMRLHPGLLSLDIGLAPTEDNPNR